MWDQANKKFFWFGKAHHSTGLFSFSLLILFGYDFQLQKAA
jgi:hypothetical protein